MRIREEVEHMENTERGQGAEIIAVEESRQHDVKTEIEKLIEEKQKLQTQLVQIQSMLYLIDSYIAEELLSGMDVTENVN